MKEKKLEVYRVISKLRRLNVISEGEADRMMIDYECEINKRKEK